MVANTKNVADMLAAYAHELEATWPQVAQAYSDMVARLVAADAGSGAPGVGDMLTAFQLPSEKGQLISSDELLAQGPGGVVLQYQRGINSIAGSYGGGRMAHRIEPGRCHPNLRTTSLWR